MTRSRVPSKNVRSGVEPDVPSVLADAARQTLDELHLLIAAETRELADRHAEAFRERRDALQALFFTYSSLPEPKPFDPAGPPPVIERQWNPLLYRQSSRRALAPFEEVLEQLQSIDIDAFQALLAQAASEGYQRELWLLALGGLDTEELLDAEPEDWEATLRDNAFDQQDWEFRLNSWVTVTRDKMQRWVAGMALSGSDWGDTVLGYERLTASHTQHVAGLLGNEAFRAFTAGALVAMAVVGRERPETEVAMVWLTRQDRLVCPICARLHQTVTTLRPVDDTHPGCRCIKVPVVFPFNVVAPLPFTSFRGDR